MSWHSLRPPISAILADTWADDHSTSERDNATHRVHDSRPCKVDCPMPQAPVDAALGEPTAAPDPVGVETIRQCDPQAKEAEILPGPTLGHRSSRDRRSGVHKHHHKEKQRHHPCVTNG